MAAIEVFAEQDIHSDAADLMNDEVYMPAGQLRTLLTLARAGAEWMFASEETVEKIARAIREEIVRQHREDERRTFPGGSHYYEETQSPWLIARAALAALSQKE